MIHKKQEDARQLLETKQWSLKLKQCTSLQHSQKQKKLEESSIIPEDIILPHDDERISFTLNFKYLGSVITLLLNEDAHSRPFKHTSLRMWSMEHFKEEH